MHCITPHSSLPNRSAKSRRTLIFEYRANDSFPIFYGEGTTAAESKPRPIRGKPARFARFGGAAAVDPALPAEVRFALRAAEADQDRRAQGSGAGARSVTRLAANQRK